LARAQRELVSFIWQQSGEGRDPRAVGKIRQQKQLVTNRQKGTFHFEQFTVRFAQINGGR
jgi:hypothetical protein